MNIKITLNTVDFKEEKKLYLLPHGTFDEIVLHIADEEKSIDKDMNIKVCLSELRNALDKIAL